MSIQHPASDGAGSAQLSSTPPLDEIDALFAALEHELEDEPTTVRVAKDREKTEAAAHEDKPADHDHDERQAHTEGHGEIEELDEPPEAHDPREDEPTLVRPRTVTMRADETTLPARRSFAIPELRPRPLRMVPPPPVLGYPKVAPSMSQGPISQAPANSAPMELRTSVIVGEHGHTRHHPLRAPRRLLWPPLIAGAMLVAGALLGARLLLHGAPDAEPTHEVRAAALPAPSGPIERTTSGDSAAVTLSVVGRAQPAMDSTPSLPSPPRTGAVAADTGSHGASTPKAQAPAKKAPAAVVVVEDPPFAPTPSATCTDSVPVHPVSEKAPSHRLFGTEE